MLAAALAVSICAVLMYAQEQTGLVLHLCFDVPEAVAANPGYAMPFITFLLEKIV